MGYVVAYGAVQHRELCTFSVHLSSFNYPRDHTQVLVNTWFT